MMINLLSYMYNWINYIYTKQIELLISLFIND